MPSHPKPTFPLPEEVPVVAAPSAQSVYRAIYAEGVAELGRSGRALFWSGFAAGLSMGTSLLAEGLLRHYLPEASWTPLISKLGYAVGFLVVILGRQQLFTENTVTPIFPMLQERTLQRLAGVSRLTTVVLLSNVLGALAFAWLLTMLRPFTAEVRDTIIAVCVDAVECSPWQHFTSGIFAGWIIALVVWLLPFAGQSRVIIIIGFTYLIGLGGFSHVIAGSVEGAYLAMNEPVSAWRLLYTAFLPTLVGNTLGGLGLVAAVNHGQAGLSESVGTASHKAAEESGGKG